MNNNLLPEWRTKRISSSYFYGAGEFWFDYYNVSINEDDMTFSHRLIVDPKAKRMYDYVSDGKKYTQKIKFSKKGAFIMWGGKRYYLKNM